MSRGSLKGTSKTAALKKKKKKKKKKKVRTYPSRNAVQSPPIPEEEEIDEDEDYDETTDDGDESYEDMDERGVDEEGEFIGSVPQESPLHVVPTFSDGSLDYHQSSRPSGAESPVGFYIGGELLEGPLDEDEAGLGFHEITSEELLRVPSVAAQKFRRSVSGEPTATPMFGEVSEEPRQSEHAASLFMPSEDPSSTSLNQKATVNDDKVKFTVGADSTYPSVAKMEEVQQDSVWTPRADDEVSSTTDETSNSNAGPATASEMKRVSSTDSARSTRSKHHHHHRKEHFRQEDLNLRRQKGSEVHLNDALKHYPTEVEEAAFLHKADLDEMSSHRFADVPGLRRPRIKKRKALHSVVHIGKSHKEKRERVKKKQFDHSPHEVFVELDELHMGGEVELEWREKARWIKFEEDVEEGAERWGKPHVASLSFHSLLELRRGLEQGVLLFDLEASDVATIVNAVVEQMVVNDLLKEEDRGKLIRTLLLKHRHVSSRPAFLQRTKSYSNLVGLDSNERQRHQREKTLMPKTLSLASFGSSMGLNRSDKYSSNHQLNSDGRQRDDKVKAKLEIVKVDVDNNMELTTPNSVPSGKDTSPEAVIFRESFIHFTDKMTDGVHIGLVPVQEQQKKHVQDIMRRIPVGSEVSTVLVGKVEYMTRPALAFVRLSQGEFLENLTEVPLPVRFVFIVLGPDTAGMDYHEVGRSISTLMSNQAFHEVAYKAESRDELLHAINLFLDDSIVLPPGDWDQRTLLPIMDMARKRAHLRRRKKQKEKEALLEKGSPDIPSDPLQRTGCIFGGLINDIKRRYPYYISDFRDAMNIKCIMASIFIFFACVSPCIAFGGLLEEKTGGLMGVSETMVSTAVAGMIFSLLCGQPLMLIGATGPVLVFEQSLYSFASSNGIEFLPMRVWIGLWVAVISTITVAAEGSFLIRYVTRFTEEIFAILISIIFIYEVVKKLVYTFEHHPLAQSYNCSYFNQSILNDTQLTLGDRRNLSVSDYAYNDTMFRDFPKHSHDEMLPQPNTALLSLILTLGTFLIAYFLRIFRNSKFLGRSVRRALGDFGVLIALLCMSLLDYLIKDTYTQKLAVPSSITPTLPQERSWFINPMGMRKQIEVWVVFATIIPAFLIFILLFMEVQITEMILSKKERKLKKGSGYHLDQFIMGLLTFACALFGLPWMCAATVRTMAHVSALSSYSRTHAPGEKPHLLGVKEQRFTNFAVHLFIGLSLLMGPVLRAIPVMALFGVFLYLGVSAMSGVQMFERIKLLLMPVKYHPSVGYVRRVRVTKMHLFTIIQLVFLVVLLIIKSTQAALAFPFALILLIPVRLKVINRFFTEKELHELDKEEEDSEMEDEDEPDFYQMAHMPI
ncbi:band 3 anion transport protein-like isoform X2 [Pomacea canaliculata]|uniref:band 3 anion transport protein-like isoform X2 n=1 Tax=Pomacea canaliculata TaxID=400727 RepID=UPI000D7360A9|nr:band 3 anion transport protein-like isoform X2 [Pomacea canaliculata]